VNEYETYIVGDFKIKFTEDSESFIQLTKGINVNGGNTHYLLYQRECPDENGIGIEEIKEEKKNDFSDEIKDEFKVNDDDKVSTDFINVFNPLNNYFSNPSSSPSSSSHSSGEWIRI